MASIKLNAIAVEAEICCPEGTSGIYFVPLPWNNKGDTLSVRAIFKPVWVPMDLRKVIYNRTKFTYYVC
jgi:hypothetical protein